MDTLRSLLSTLPNVAPHIPACLAAFATIWQNLLDEDGAQTALLSMVRLLKIIAEVRDARG